MKVTFRLPSKAVQYGYAEVEFDLDDKAELDYQALGDMYANHVKDFWVGEKPAKPKTPDAAAVAEFEEQLGAKKIGEEPSVTTDDDGEKAAPWEAEPKAPAGKPWEKKPNLFG